MKTRLEIINHYIRENEYTSYLEVGVYRGVNLAGVECSNKIGVDPVWPCSHQMTSDEFFKQNTRKFDLIFIDGLHESEQAIRDIANALDCLNPGGMILMHDCLPENKAMQQVPRIVKDWTGDVWKAFLYYRRRPDLEMCVFDCDFGVGMIRPGKQTPVIVDKPTWAGFKKNKQAWMNIKTT